MKQSEVLMNALKILKPIKQKITNIVSKTILDVMVNISIPKAKVGTTTYQYAIKL